MMIALVTLGPLTTISKGVLMNMKSLFLATVLVIAASAAHAFSFDNRQGSEFKTFVGPVTLVTRNFVSWSQISFNDSYSKVIVAAQEDAVTFVASNGEIRGAQLSQAIKLIKEVAPQVTSTDMELAVAIVNATPSL
jgi:uncharacterized protein (TIGR02448 family)